MSRVVSIVSHKGGVSKTTSTISLSNAWGKMGLRVLVIDNDPQANATKGLGFPKGTVSSQKSVYELFKVGTNKNYDDPEQVWDSSKNNVKSKIKELILKTDFQNVCLLPSHVEYTDMENQNIDGYEYILANAISQIWDDFDYIVIDTPPSLGRYTKCALTASTDMLVPIQCEPFALDGVAGIMRTLDIVQARLNPHLKFTGSFITMLDNRTNFSQKAITTVKNYFRDRLFNTMIPRTIKVAESQDNLMPVQEFMPDHKVSQAYNQLAKEVIERE